MKSEKVVNEFVSTLSHEIRTPLTSIKGFSETMLQNWSSLSDEQKKKFLNIILEQSQRLINLVENVLNVAKLENDDEVILKEIDLHKMVKNTLELVKINHKGRVFSVFADDNVPPVMADYDKLQQILVNILDNACKYSEGEISARVLNNGSVEIIDCGAGIGAEDLENIFKKFYRAQNLLTSKTQGSGLGLYIANSLAERMGGYISVQSAPKETKFTVSLPVCETEALAKRVQG